LYDVRARIIRRQKLRAVFILVAEVVHVASVAIRAAIVQAWVIILK
jgi:hypothetical protein